MPTALLLLAASLSPVADSAAFIRDELRLARYRSASVDLNGDGAKEVLVLAQDQDRCGSGGCTLYILTPDHTRFRIVSRLTIVRAPVRALASVSNGWRDLAVQVAGGGIVPGYTARLRFDGSRYPGNPGLPPAMRLTRPSGRILIE